MTTVAAAVAFSEAVEPRLRESRRELVREVQARLVAFEHSGSDLERGRLLQLLDDLATLVRAEPSLE